MRETESNHGRWFRVSHSLSAKLNVLLLTAMVAIFGLLGYLNVHLHRQHLEQNTLLSAERISDAIKRGTTEYMLRDDQAGLHHSIQAIASEPGMERIRIFDKEGRITYSTDPSEQNHVVDKSAEACYGCHAQSQPLARLNRPDRFRIYRNSAGSRVLGIITPIENQPGCTNAPCHAHPAEQQILGVLDTNLSLAKADIQLAETSRRMKIYTACALLLIMALSWFFIWRVVARPITALKRATEHLASGDLGYQIQVRSEDEIAELARSFNDMSSRLESEHSQNLVWTHTLEERVDEKTRELTRAHEHALQTEKMASIGKMAAVLAHEINNPLSGILTYAKLLRKWTDREDCGAGRRPEIHDSLDLIASESRRCGDLVRNLLTFSRATPMNLQPTDLNRVIEQSLRLVQHQADLAGIHVQPQLQQELPPVRCDAAQIEQVLLALIMNAMDAMPQGGNLWIISSSSDHRVQIVVRDDGAGIPPEILPRIFEPFLTTKETGRGVGLGLAISHSILERHNGTIEVQSEVGRGTTFTVILPVDAETKKIDAPPAAELAAGHSKR
ncbi:MAG TPA: ATP-binding protein [Candidatus Binatia bacterium]|jgi:two-component system NtrC family sensor kinase|nr:ATP-binding protein [Candidatus Binatia bacterium]